ncbi:MAG: beta strand repeat-containing protein [Limisphaerales bacterium]
MFRQSITAILMLDMAMSALANPHGMTVQSGTATTTVNGSQLTITTSQNAALNWQSFNIAAGETTIFQQPSSTSIVWNNINNQNPSQIYGSLQANGIVVLLNSSGFYFGPNSFVSAAGLVVSTANCAPPQNSGGSWEFNGPPPLASIVNYGQLKIGNGGSAFLIADQIDNHGTIEAPGGTIGLAAGQTVLLSDRPDGRGMSMRVRLPAGSVDNEGRLIADGGTIAMNAQVVNQNGFIQANSVKDVNGIIELVAADQLNLGADSQISASGDDSAGGSAGGDVTLKSGNTFSDSVGSQIDLTGGSQGGNGGNVEISAPSVLSLNSGIDARAQAGWTAGELLLDPLNIILNTSGTGNAGSGTVLAGSNPGSTLSLNVNSAFANLAVSQIILQAMQDITLAGSTSGGTVWNLSGTIGANFGGVTSGQLTLEAGRNIIFGNGSQIIDANNWSVTLLAGYDFVHNTVQSGAGSIYIGDASSSTVNGTTVFTPLDDSGSIQTAGGSVNLTAGQDILVGSGYVITTGGGTISVHALAGNIDTGSDAQGYHFKNSASSVNAAYNLQDGLGGISTGAGGNVTLIAGGNVTSVLPSSAGNYYYDGNQTPAGNGTEYLTAGAGAYGSQPGNVTIVAGGNVTGHYLVANGTGSIYAGVQMNNGSPVTDSSGNYVLGATGNAGTDLQTFGLSLSLISGGWNVVAAQNIFLEEVNNPNGLFNSSGSYSHYFNYANNAYVDLSAGNQVQLGTSTTYLPRLASANNIPIIYAPILNITAGDGGVILGGPGSTTSLTLFPSPQGSLTIDTTGSLVSDLNTINGGAPQLFNLIVSDAGHNQYTTTGNFGLSDHAAAPIHEDTSTPIYLKIGGDMDLVYLVVPEAAQIIVDGNMNNCAFQGMNVSADPGFQVQVHEADGSTRTITVDPGVTSINVAGAINNRSAFTSVDLSQYFSQVPGAQAPDLSVLSQAVTGPGEPSATQLATSFYYNSTTHVLTYQNITGASLASILQLLQNLTIQVYNNGVPQFDNNGNPITTTVSVLDSGEAQALLAQYNALGPIPNNANTYGYFLGGGGQFNITAQTIDLGTSAGIVSEGVGLYTVRGSYPLAGLFGSAGVFTRGADITVSTTGNHSDSPKVTASGDLIGDLDMYSSSIASLDGGNIYINAGGDINAGSADFSVNTLGARGIYTTGQGNVDVYAQENIDVNGSRIANYDLPRADGSTSPGGSVTVMSLNGDIDAGNGSSGFVVVSSYQEGADGTVTAETRTIPGSGILGVSYVLTGNTLVEAPNGTINAGAGGIPQLLLNTPPLPESTTLFDLPLNHSALAEMFNLALTGHMKSALAMQTGLNGIPGNTQVSVYAGYELQMLADSLTPAEILAGDTLQNLPAGLQEVVDKNGNLIELADSLTPAQVKAGDKLQNLPVGLQAVVDQNGNPVVNANNLSGATLVRISDDRDIDATGSGVIGAGSVTLEASGNITGNIFALNNVNVNAVNNVDVTVLGLGNVNVTTAGGTISGTIIGVGSVSASGGSIDANLESNGSVSGSTSGQVGLAPGTAADAASQGVAMDNSATKAANSSDDQDDELKKKKGKAAALVQKTGRVTVILPPRQQSKAQTTEPRT